MQEGPLLPKPFYISGTPKKRERSKLFRPKELREYVFPELGMIMYPLFWVKYTLHLVIKMGCDISTQKHLFFWADKDDRIDPSEGVLYYSLLSRLYSREHGIEDVSVGSDWAKGWLFKLGWKDIILDELEKFVKDPENFEFHRFTENVFSSDFKTDCKRARINLLEVIKKEMLSMFKGIEEKDNIKIVQEAIKAFVWSLMRVFWANKKLYCKEGAVIEPNIFFTQKVLLQTSDLNELPKLANVNFKFTKEELRILLTVLQSTEKGKYFLRSLLLVSYMDPTNNSNSYIRKKMRDIFDIYEKVDDLVEIKRRFAGLYFNPSVLSGLEETCFYWELNFFLADGEEIARRLLTRNLNGVRIIRENDIKEYFFVSDDEYISNFKNFLKKLGDKKRRAHLFTLIKRVKIQGSKESKDIADYMFRLLEGIEKHNEPYKIFLDLVLVQGTLKKEAGKLYSIVAQPPEEISSAFFYGIDPLIDWSRTILRGLCNE